MLFLEYFRKSKKVYADLFVMVAFTGNFWNIRFVYQQAEVMFSSTFEPPKQFLLSASDQW